MRRFTWTKSRRHGTLFSHFWRCNWVYASDRMDCRPLTVLSMRGISCGLVSDWCWSMDILVPWWVDIVDHNNCAFSSWGGTFQTLSKTVLCDDMFNTLSYKIDRLYKVSTSFCFLVSVFKPKNNGRGVSFECLYSFVECLEACFLLLNTTSWEIVRTACDCFCFLFGILVSMMFQVHLKSYQEEISIQLAQRFPGSCLEIYHQKLSEHNYFCGQHVPGHLNQPLFSCQYLA